MKEQTETKTRVLAFKTKNKMEVLKKLLFLENSPKKYEGLMVLEDEPDGFYRIQVNEELVSSKPLGLAELGVA